MLIPSFRRAASETEVSFSLNFEMMLEGVMIPEGVVLPFFAFGKELL
jgi:hypothetical protein